MVKDFHEFFGFSRNGINSQVLVSPELDGVKDKQHWFLRKSRYSFLRSAHLGLVVPSDARLFFNMNPSQILGVMVGFYSMVRSGNTGRWIKEPAALYLDLLSRARASYKRELDYIDRVANERAVQIFSESNQSLDCRLKCVLDRNPDIAAKFLMSDSLKYYFNSGMDNEFDPGTGNVNATNRRRYAKHVLNGLNSRYRDFRSSENYSSELVMARNAMIIP